MKSYIKSESKEWAREFLQGQWSTLVTPFNEQGNIDEKGLRSNIEYVKSLGSNGAGCSWGMGEFWSMTTEERKNLMQIVIDQAQDWPVAAHVTHTSVNDIIELLSYTEQIGYELLIIGAPYFATRKPSQVIEFIEYICSKTDLAIMYYNSPQFGTILNESELDQIVNIENIVGVKEASFNKEISINSHKTLGEKAVISTPDEWIFWEGEKLGFQQQVMFANTSDWRFDTPDNNSYTQFVQDACKGNIDNDLYVAGVTQMDYLIVIRCLSFKTHLIHEIFKNIWVKTRHLIAGKQASSPRIFGFSSTTAWDRKCPIQSRNTRCRLLDKACSSKLSLRSA